MKITVVGSGGWGTALAILLHKNGHQDNGLVLFPVRGGVHSGAS